jgi:hypothetical protein
MRAAVAHINLLQRTADAHTTAWILLALVAATIVGVVYHGSNVRSQAQADIRRADDLARQVKDLQARLAARQGDQGRSAAALSLRKEIDALAPQAQATQALVDAVRNAEGGRTEEFSRPLVAMTGLNEPGLWLTALTVTAGGKRLELHGQAGNGAAVLRFARRVNASLQPLTLRLDSLEMQPAEGAAPGRSTVSFRMY